VRDGLRLADSLRRGPILLGHLVRMGLCREALKGLEWALNVADFTDRQLTELDEMLAASARTLDLTEALNRHFSQEGLSFLAPYPGRWYLKTARPEPVLTDAPQAVVGREVSLRPFGGEHATLWHRRLTEAQMLLHRHPVNQVREEQGQLPVNSLWIWGGGVLPPAAPAPFASVISDEPLSRGLACWSRTECRPLPQTANSFPEPKKSAHLLVLDLLLETFPERDLQGWQDAILKLERDWFRPLLAVAKKRGDIHWALHAIGAERSIRITANRNDLWRFWRRAPG